MKSNTFAAAFAVIGSAAASGPDKCCFHLEAAGGVSGALGQLGDGQNRLNGTYPPATYCYSNGGITDADGRGCIVTVTNDATHQFQCDQGTKAQAGFSISANGSLSFDGNDQFYACPYNNGDTIEYNVYTQELAGQEKCRPISLSTGGKCGTTGSTCSVSTTTVYVVATTSVHSVPSSIASTSEYTPVPSVSVWTDSGSTPVAATSVSVWSASGSASTVEIASTFTEIPTPSSASTASQVTYSATTETETSRISAPVHSSATYTTVLSYTTTLETVVSTSTYSNVWSTSTVPSRAVVTVPAYNASSTLLTTTWTAAATTSAPFKHYSNTTINASTWHKASTTVATPSTSASVCQTALNGAYQTPHLIVPVSSSSPNTAYGTQYDAYIDSDNSTIFNFDIPSSYEDKTCTTIFLFPEIADLETSSYTFSGSGDLVFSELATPATEQTTYDTAPPVRSVLDTIAIAPGNSYVVASGPCAAGSTISIELSSQGGLSLEFFEDWNPSSLGLYITAC